MPRPLLLAKHGTNHRDSLAECTATANEVHSTREDDADPDDCYELVLARNRSLTTSLNRVCFYWRQSIYQKAHYILTLVLVAVVKFTARLYSFARQTVPVRTTRPLTSVSTFEEERNHTSTAFINFNPTLDLPSLENSTIADMLIQQRPAHRTPNMNIGSAASTPTRGCLQISHSVDDRLFYMKPESTSFFQLLQRFASEPHISMYDSVTNGLEDQNSPPCPKSPLPMNRVEEAQEEVTPNNCDIAQQITLDDLKSDTLDTIPSPATIEDLNEDTIISTNPERHFRRRKRRSSWTPSSHSSIDESESSEVGVIEKIDKDEEVKSQEVTEHPAAILLESLSFADNNEKKEETVEEDATSSDTTAPISRLRPRRLRYRSYRQPISSSEPVCETSVTFFVPTEATVTSAPTPSTPPPSPPSADSITSTNANTLSGALKRVGSVGATKKMVRFADSVGKELAQVQYIRSRTEDDTKDPHWSKSDLYVPTAFNFEPKPWSFDVALTPNQLPETRQPKRFFCLYRQPVSEHPDIYLHEVWKSQIKLEHADMRAKPSSNVEQYLHGTAWVTNAGFWKNVTVKYTFNRWLNTYEYDAQYRCHSNDFRNIDQFEFNIDIPQDVDRIDFVLRYQVNCQEYWDNNEGRNYTIETESSTTPQTTISLPHDCDFNEMRFY